MPRAIVCILDSFGIGGAPDAADYGDGHGHNDVGSDTLGHIAGSTTICMLPNLDALGPGRGEQSSRPASCRAG